MNHIPMNSGANVSLVTYLTIRKGQDTDDQEEGDNHNKTNSEIVV